MHPIQRQAHDLVRRTTGWNPGLCKSAMKFVTLALAIAGCRNAAVSTSAMPAEEATIFTYPAAGATISPFHKFSWNPDPEAISYTLEIGTAKSARDVYITGGIPPETTSLYVWGLLPARTYYATLWVETSAFWVRHDIRFQTAAASAGKTSTQLFKQVGLLAESVRTSAGQDNIPEPGSLLEKKTTERGRKLADCLDQSNALLELFAENNIYARRLDVELVGDTDVGHTTTEYYDLNIQKWIVADPTFGLIFFNPSTGSGDSAEEVSEAVKQQAWSSIPYTWITANGSLYANHYLVDPITLYLHVVRVGQGYGSEDSPLPYLTESSPGLKGTYIFLLDGPATLHTPDRVELTPASGNWSLAYKLYDGWTLTGDAKVYSFQRFLF